jgi:hypothetical protein
MYLVTFSGCCFDSQQGIHILSGASYAQFEGFLHCIFTFLLLGQVLRETSSISARKEN